MKAAFYEWEITPPLGESMPGYYAVRIAEDVADKLYAKVFAAENDGVKIALLVLDCVELPTKYADALEQGMDSKTLSAIMGHYSVSFTLDTYAHVLDDHKQVGMALMGDLFEMQPSVPAEILYPVLVTTFDDFSVEIVSLNYPDVNYAGNNMAEGLQFIKESLHEKSLTEGNYAAETAVVPPVLEQNQMLINLSI